MISQRDATSILLSLPGSAGSDSCIAGEDRGAYDLDGASPGAESRHARRDRRGQSPVAVGDDGGALRTAVEIARTAVRRVQELVDDESRPESDETASLAALLRTVDAGNQAAVALTGRIQSRRLAERQAGLELESWLSMQSQATHGERRTLSRVASTLATMPHLRARFRDGSLGFGQVRAIEAEARSLPAAERAQLDAAFADHRRIAETDPDALVDEVREAVGRLAPKRERDRSARRYERRYLAFQLGIDGSAAGTFELDPEGMSLLSAAIEDAAAAPSAGPRDVTRDAIGVGDPDELAAQESDDADGEGTPGFADPVAWRSRARQRADALIALAESWLSGGRDSRQRPRRAVTAVCDIRHLTGHAPAAVAGRLLLQTVGASMSLTDEAVGRLSEDATLSFLLHDRGEILGVSRPTTTIPARVRAAVEARDQGCRFPGCPMPIAWCDLHHVVARTDEGPTTADNLVALCRRHHTAVTEGRWRLAMDEHGVVTVRRGRRWARSRPRIGHPLLGDASDGSTSTSRCARSAASARQPAPGAASERPPDRDIARDPPDRESWERQRPG